MPKPMTVVQLVLSGWAVPLFCGCAFIHYDKGAGPNVNAGQQPAAVNANPEQSALAMLASQSGGPGGGWIIAASRQNIEQHSLGSAQQADRQARQQPAGIADIERSDNADLNGDGFVTLDEILALKRAGLTSEQIITRIQRTPQVFSLAERQQQYLRDRGIDPHTIDAMLAKGQ
jgi:hypothetical protein